MDKQIGEIQALQQKVVNFRNARNWKQFHNPKDLAISLVLEASELLEHFQWKDIAEAERHVATKKEDVAEELADVFYCVLLLANDLGIDLPEAFESKLAKNELNYPVAKATGNHKKYTELEAQE
jgi:NTP pyrophosphatase (non-canonical NTP hydrolase)